MDQFLAGRAKTLPQPAMLALYQQAQALKVQGYDVYDPWGIGEPSFPTPHYIQQAAKQAIDTGSLL